MTSHVRTIVGRWSVGLLSLSFLALVGCSAVSLAPVTGTVKSNGEPVKAGTIVFSPLAEKGGGAGKAASGDIKSDGTFALTTTVPGDGAAVGRHRVTFTPAEPEMTEEQRTNPKVKPPAPSPYLGLVVKDTEVEVKSSANTINIELVPAAASKQRQVTSTQDEPPSVSPRWFIVLAAVAPAVG